MNARPSSAIRTFTLIELTIVLLVVCILLGVAAPALPGFARGRETVEEARRLLALSRYARSEAVSRADVVELWLDPETGSYGLRSLLRGAGEPMAAATEIMPEGLSLVVEREESTADESCSLTWGPDGSLDCADLIAIHVLNTRDPADCPVLLPDPQRSCLTIAVENRE